MNLALALTTAATVGLLLTTIVFYERMLREERAATAMAVADADLFAELLNEAQGRHPSARHLHIVDGQA